MPATAPSVKGNVSRICSERGSAEPVSARLRRIGESSLQVGLDVVAAVLDRRDRTRSRDCSARSASRRAGPSAAASWRMPGDRSASTSRTLLLFCFSVADSVSSESRTDVIESRCSFIWRTTESTLDRNCLMPGSLPCANALSWRVMSCSWRDAAAVEQQRERAEHLLDLDTVVRPALAGSRRGRPACRSECRPAAVPATRTSRRAASSARWTRSRSPAGATSPLTSSDDVGVAAVLRQVDRVDAAHGHAVDPDARLRDEVERVVELRDDRVRVVAEIGAAGQRDVVQALRQPAPAQREQRAGGHDRAGQQPASS